MQVEVRTTCIVIFVSWDLTAFLLIQGVMFCVYTPR
jgi:hypothetical protein